MKKNFAFIFPGQGAQSVGMGRDFYKRFLVARETFQQGDEILQRALSKLIFNGPVEQLTETRNSQSAIYLVSMAILRVLRQQFPDLAPSLCAGLSLGEYSALAASDHLSFEETLSLVQFRSEAMNAACEATKGGMAALFGLSGAQVEQLVRELNMPNDLWVANYNCPGQTVISGTLKGIEAGIAAAKSLGAKRAIPLKVHGAFHSGLMRLAEEKLAVRMQEVTVNASPVRLVMNVCGDFVDDPEAIKQNLVRQVCSSVRWEQGIRAMQPSTSYFLEIGCGRTLAGMNKLMDAPTLSISTVEDLEKMETVL